MGFVASTGLGGTGAGLMVRREGVGELPLKDRLGGGGSMAAEAFEGDADKI